MLTLNKSSVNATTSHSLSKNITCQSWWFFVILFTMKAKKLYKIVVYVPETHADKLRKAMGNAGAGKIGKYSHCTFTIKGTGRFKPLEGANPTIGEIGNLEEV